VCYFLFSNETAIVWVSIHFVAVHLSFHCYYDDNIFICAALSFSSNWCHIWCMCGVCVGGYPVQSSKFGQSYSNRHHSEDVLLHSSELFPIYFKSAVNVECRRKIYVSIYFANGECLPVGISCLYLLSLSSSATQHGARLCWTCILSCTFVVSTVHSIIVDMCPELCHMLDASQNTRWWFVTRLCFQKRILTFLAVTCWSIVPFKKIVRNIP